MKLSEPIAPVLTIVISTAGIVYYSVVHQE